MDRLSEIVGDSRAIAGLRADILQILRSITAARRPPAVLICGETGTGKGLVSHALHRAGPRGQGPFIDVNCAAIPDQLLEAELFGFERGAFTDAHQAKSGLFQLAHRGTLFLDEIGLLSEPLQAKLLKVLEDGAVRRLGGTRMEPADVWILAATSEDLPAAMRAQRFRADLYHRLAVLVLKIPPLREREGDVLLLAERFLARACADYGLAPRSLAPDARDALAAHSFPGNVRELGNVIERVALLTDGPTVTAAHLSLPEPARDASPAPPRTALRSAREQIRHHLLQVLTETGWNISRTSAILGISRNTVKAHIARFRLARTGAEGATRPNPVSPPPAPSVTGAVSPAETPASVSGITQARPRLRWEPRHVALLRLDWTMSEGSDGLPDPTRVLGDILDKVVSFGGQIEELASSSLLAAFGVEPAEDAPARAALAALAVNRLGGPQGAGPRVSETRAALDAATIPAIRLEERSYLDLTGKRETRSTLEKLAAAAAPGTVLASPAAATLLRRRFQLAPIGTAPADGALGWRVLGLEPSRFRAGRIAAFVGRSSELRVLQARLALAREGRGQLVGIAGEPGIGKSRLLWEFRETLHRDEIAYLEGQCVSYGAMSPFLPITDLVRAACGLTDADPSDVVRDSVARALEELDLDRQSMPFFLHLLRADPGEHLVGLSPEAVSARMIEAVLQMLLAASRRRPLVVAVEDLHWIDQASLSCLAALADRVAPMRLLLVVTYREGTHLSFLNRPYATQVALPPLSTEDCVGMARAMLGVGADDTVTHAIAVRADGNPLFIEELTLAAIKGGTSAENILPPSLQSLLAARLDRLGPSKAVAQAAAVIGESFSLAMLDAVAEPDVEPAADHLRRLVEAEIVVPAAGGSDLEYRFRHALIHDAAYQNQVPDSRRSLHARAARALEEKSGDVAGAHPELVAHHLTEAGQERAAIPWWVRAGTRARQQAAYADAIRLLERALGLLETLPPGPDRDRLELEIQVSLGISLQATRGFAAPEVGALHARGRELCRRVEGGPLLLAALGGLFLYYLYRADLAAAREMAEQHRTVTEQIGALNRLCASHSALGLAAFQTGALAEARAELARSIELADTYPRPAGTALTPSNIGVVSESMLAMTLAVQGELDAAVAASQRALDRADRCPPSERAFSLAYAATCAARVHLFRRETDPARENAERAVEIGGAHGFGLLVGIGRISDAAARVLAGEDAAMDKLAADVSAWRERGLELDTPYWLSIVAEGRRAAGRHEGALLAVGEALGAIAGHGASVFESELLRLRGELVASREPAAARIDLERALSIARAQGARLFELRAAMSLYRLGGPGAAGSGLEAMTSPLASVVGAFREGHGTADVREALTLLGSAGAGETGRTV